MDLIISIIIPLAILLFSVILHEVAHAAVADYFGDDTAKMLGRITLNPLYHIDPFFTILLPAAMALPALFQFIAHQPVQTPLIFGAAKPVPVNYFRLRNYRWGVFWVSSAGIITNLCLAVIATIPLHFSGVNDQAQTLCREFAQINIILFGINIIPIPPIDGSKIFAALLGEWAINKVAAIEMRGMLGVLPFLFIVYFVFMSGIFNVYLGFISDLFFRLVGAA